MSSRYPGALWLPLLRNYTARVRTTTRGVILHVAGSEARSLFGWFNQAIARASCQLYVRRDGVVEQYVDGRFSSWTSGAASYSTIGVETQGADAGGRWTAAQVESLARILAWAHREYGTPLVPLVTMRTSKASERGIGWHRLGVPASAAQKSRGVSQTGGQLWSSAVGKVCPGDARIAQIPAVIARARALVGDKAPIPTPTPDRPAPATPEEFLMTLSDDEQSEMLRKVRAVYETLPAHAGHKTGDGPMGQLLKAIRTETDRLAEIAQTSTLLGRFRPGRTNVGSAGDLWPLVAAALASPGGGAITDIDEEDVAERLADLLAPDIAQRVVDLQAARLSRKD